MKLNSSNRCLVLLVILSITSCGYSQVIEAGLKGGLTYSWVRYDDANFSTKVKTSPILGYSGGAVLSFKVKDRYFLHTEYLFTTKGRKNTDYVNDEVNVKDYVFRDKARYYFLEVPMLYNVFFKGHLKMHGDKRFKYYAGAGPLFSYWLGGKGKVFADDFLENEFPELKYNIQFGERNEEESIAEEVYIAKPRRLQLGFAIGGGLMTEPDAKKRIMVDLRFEYGHSWLAKSDAEDYVIPLILNRANQQAASLQARNMGLRFSAIYLLEINSNKKVRNKGKSNIKKKVKRK